jgi:ferritin
VTKTIYALYEQALQVRDYASHVLLEWFVSEQVEEEKTLEELVEHVKLIGDDGTGLIVLDERLGRRTADQSVMPSTSSS